MGLALRYLANNNRVREAYDLIEARSEAMIAAAPKHEAELLSRAIAEAVGEHHYGDGPARWQADPYTADRWPRLALKLTTQLQAVGIDPPFNSTLATMVKGDYRANPELTLAVSGSDNAIIDWTRKELARPEVLRRERSEGWSDPLTLPLRIQLRWHGVGGDDGEAELITIACAGSPERQMLFREWGMFGGSNSVRMVFRLALTPGMTEADRAVLAQAIVKWDARNVAEGDESWLAEEGAGRKIARGEALTPEDIVPIKPPVCPAL